MAERKTFKERMAEVEQDRLAKVQHRLAKIEAKALKKTPESAEWVIYKAAGDAEMRGLMGRGWEIVDYPAKGVYQDWVKQYTMRRNRAELAAVHANSTFEES